ncbi:MAG: SDR family oxidoreductase [candidate division Zixibacteria bacterium]|nr:SDR family oxidoreductase [candidate division Zixibacteria bacterium]
MRYLITGGAGFIGSNIAIELVRRGEDVTVLDIFSTGREENLSSIRDEIAVIRGDIRDYETVTSAVRGVDHVIHQAAIASVESSIEDPVGSSEVNINGTLKLLEACKREGVKRFVMASSAAVYGNIPSLPKTEDSEVQALSPYAAAKLTGEHYCNIYHDLFGLETVALRYFNVFGRNQDPASEYAAVIPKFINALLLGKPPVIYGDGLQTRDFVFVDNVVSANLLAVESKDAAGKVINIASGRKYTLLDLVAALWELMGVDIEPIFEKEKPGDIRHSVADISKATKLLGYDILTDFKEGLRHTIEYFKTMVPRQVRAR